MQCAFPGPTATCILNFAAHVARSRNKNDAENRRQVDVATGGWVEMGRTCTRATDTDAVDSR